MKDTWYTGGDGDKVSIPHSKDFAGCVASARVLVKKKDELWVRSRSLVTDDMETDTCLGHEIKKLEVDKETITLNCDICNIVFDFRNRLLTFNSDYSDDIFDAMFCGYDKVRSLFYFIVKFVIDTPAPGLELDDFEAQDAFINEYY
jgi:hypothetical protein